MTRRWSRSPILKKNQLVARELSRCQFISIRSFRLYKKFCLCVCRFVHPGLSVDSINTFFIHMSTGHYHCKNKDRGGLLCCHALLLCLIFHLNFTINFYNILMSSFNCSKLSFSSRQFFLRCSQISWHRRTDRPTDGPTNGPTDRQKQLLVEIKKNTER